MTTIAGWLKRDQGIVVSPSKSMIFPISTNSTGACTLIWTLGLRKPDWLYCRWPATPWSEYCPHLGQWQIVYHASETRWHEEMPRCIPCISPSCPNLTARPIQCRWASPSRPGCYSTDLTWPLRWWAGIGSTTPGTSPLVFYLTRGSGQYRKSN